MVQTILQFKTESDYSPYNFMVSGSNQEAFQWIEKWPDWPSHCLIIYGLKSSGKSHLCKIWQEKNSEGIVIEDIDREIDEEELFHLYNSAKSEGKYILLTSKSHPSSLDLKLPDLRSRLKSCPAIAINLPDDELLSFVLTKHFSDRQLKVNKEVMNYLLLRIERSFVAAENIVDSIDKLSLQEKRNITIPLVRKVLEGQ